MPPLANQFINLIKDSSVVSLISIQELTFMAVEVGVSTTRVFEVWITIAVAYFVICYGCALSFNKIEERMMRNPR
jgi:polar amino acid transport system permease protein